MRKFFVYKVARGTIGAFLHDMAWSANQLPDTSQPGWRDTKFYAPVVVRLDTPIMKYSDGFTPRT